MTLYGEALDGVIIMGTGSQPVIVLESYHETLHRLMLGNYNKKFEKGLTQIFSGSCGI